MLTMFVIRGAFAAKVQPQLVAGNPKCSDLNSGWTGVSVDGPGTFMFGSLTIHVTAVDDPSVIEGQLISWTSNTPIDAVFVKGGPNGNLYRYDPPADQSSDSGLHTPANPNGQGPKWYGLSHILFCFATTEERGGTTTGTTTGGTSTGQTSTGQTSTGQTGTGQTGTGQSSTGQSSTGQTGTGESTTGHSTTGGSSTGPSTGTSTSGSSTGTTGHASTTSKTQVLGRVFHRAVHNKGLAKTGGPTTALAWTAVMMLMIGVTIRVCVPKTAAAGVANVNAPDDLVTKTLELVNRFARGNRIA